MNTQVDIELIPAAQQNTPPSVTRINSAENQENQNPCEGADAVVTIGAEDEEEFLSDEVVPVTCALTDIFDGNMVEMDFTEISHESFAATTLSALLLTIASGSPETPDAFMLATSAAFSSMGFIWFGSEAVLQITADGFYIMFFICARRWYPALVLVRRGSVIVAVQVGSTLTLYTGVTGDIGDIFSELSLPCQATVATPGAYLYQFELIPDIEGVDALWTLAEKAFEAQRQECEAEVSCTCQEDQAPYLVQIPMSSTHDQNVLALIRRFLCESLYPPRLQGVEQGILGYIAVSANTEFSESQPPQLLEPLGVVFQLQQQVVSVTDNLELNDGSYLIIIPSGNPSPNFLALLTITQGSVSLVALIISGQGDFDVPVMHNFQGLVNTFRVVIRAILSTLTNPVFIYRHQK